MMTFSEAVLLLGAKTEKKLGNNTMLVKLDGSNIGIRLHSTVVVKIGNDGTWTLQTNGYRTKTTKERINKYSPASVWQKSHQWFIGPNPQPSLPFFDGVKVDQFGTVLNGG